MFILCLTRNFPSTTKGSASDLHLGHAWNAWKKNLLWILVRLHAREKQTISGRTGFNITVRNEVTVAKDNLGYLPTIDAPVTIMSTVFEVLSESLKIKDSLKLNTKLVVFDQALYAKVVEIK